MFRSKCKCRCHTDGWVAIHLAACCEPDPMKKGAGPLLNKLEAMQQLKVWVMRRIGSEMSREDDAHYWDEIEYCDDEIIKCCIRIADIVKDKNEKA